MYDELIKQLRYLAKVYSICENENTQEYKLAVKAADAIEELTGMDFFVNIPDRLEEQIESTFSLKKWK